MQRHENGYVIIACDFTGIDWDEHIPMIEGHRGSVISLPGLKLAIENAKPLTEPHACTMCLRTIDPPGVAWKPNPPAEHANPQAVICWDCIQQADRSFAKDPDTEWDRHIPPDERWR